MNSRHRLRVADSRVVVTQSRVLVSVACYVPSTEVVADVVFVHGLRGGPFQTWRQEGVGKSKSRTDCWPKVMVWCGVVWCGVVWCGVVWCGAVLCVLL